MTAPRICTDFNGFLEKSLLCLAHCEVPTDCHGEEVEVHSGMYAIAYEEDETVDGRPEFLVVSGIVERSPEHAAHRGSVWSIRVDERGVRHLATLEEAD